MQAEPALVALVQFRSIEEAMAAMRSRHTMPGGSGAHLELRLMP